jgi:hypothetical protein
MWLSFLSKISLIDKVVVDYKQVSTKANRQSVFDQSEQDMDEALLQVTLETLPLAQFRKPTPVEGEKYAVWWFLNGEEVVELRDNFTFKRLVESSRGIWRVDVQFVTSEVRSDPSNALFARKLFLVQ